MKNKKIKELKQWDKATDQLAQYFVEKYFGEGIDNYYYWIGSQNENKEVLAIGDYFFDLNDIVNFLRYDYSATEMFEYYDYRMDEKNKPHINIRNWKKLRK